ncbi:hypothetical protein ACFE04_024445 [Oxalis oulophora]
MIVTERDIEGGGGDKNGVVVVVVAVVVVVDGVSPPIVLSSAHTLNRVVLCPYAFRPLPNHSSPSTYHGQQLPHSPATPLILDVSNPAATRLFRSLPVAVVSIRILIAINFRTPTSN